MMRQQKHYTEIELKRKLTTIFCADVQNYGAMMAKDEVTTLKKLRQYRSIMSELFDKRDGRQVNTWGDAVIGEFSSVVEAVRCAVEIQDAISSENKAIPENQQMWFRIGINLGDVMDDDGDLYGDGVNVAARLEALSDAGGIMVSENVYQLSKKQLAFEFDFAGEHSVKNNEDPIASYRVRIGGSNQPSPSVDQTSRSTDSSGKQHQTSNTREHVRSAANSIDKFLQWYPAQKPAVRRAIGIIGIMAAINVIFSGIANPWFIYPSIPLAAYIFLTTRK